MSFMAYHNFTFGDSGTSDDIAFRTSRSNEAKLSAIARKLEERDDLLEPFRIANAKRKACGKCGNLVMPSLQKQHNQAYHA
jgi:hypothetical protein